MEVLNATINTVDLMTFIDVRLVDDYKTKPEAENISIFGMSPKTFLRKMRSQKN